jgi:hypothetical protein
MGHRLFDQDGYPPRGCIRRPVRHAARWAWPG